MLPQELTKATRYATLQRPGQFRQDGRYQQYFDAHRPATTSLCPGRRGAITETGAWTSPARE